MPPVAVIPIVNTVPANPNPPTNRDSNNVLPPGSKPGDFLVITPRNADARPKVAPVVERVAPPERAPPPKLRDPLEDRRAIGQTDMPDLQPAAEAARQVRLAREAFARGDYGEAGEHLDRALTARPDDAPAMFLKSQARFAAGQYAEAIVGIEKGLKLAPDWPGSDFNSKELYGRQPERFERQLADLRKALAAQPNEASLQFLLAYQLWFGGDRPEATNLFRLLADRLKDASAVELFLRK
jgi:tetratricopeptide (TPR) repeat protein